MSLLRVSPEQKRRLDSLEKGTQVIYTPFHVHSTSAPEAEPGFVISVLGPSVSCRFWRKDEEGKPTSELRTKANSEYVHIDNLTILSSVPQDWVDEQLSAIESY